MSLALPETYEQAIFQSIDCYGIE